MNVEISVFDPNEDKVISFPDYQFSHVDCGAMTNRSSISTDERVLKCTCGLELHFARSGDAEMAITQAVIDGQARDLESESFHSNLANAVRVYARDAA